MRCRETLRRLLGHLVALTAAASVVAEERSTGRQKVAIVADVGVDDAAGLLWALASDRLEVLGVAASFGCHWDVRRTAANARTVLRAAGREDVPVFVGSRWALGQSSPPLTDGNRFHGQDGFAGEGGPVDGHEPGLALECPASGCRAAAGPSAAEFLAQTARAWPGEVVVLCFSSLTDVALAALLEPALPRLLKSLHVMGGAVFVAGNISPLAEANFGRDPAAAQAVLQAFGGKEAVAGSSQPAPLVLAPLDVTLQALLTPSELQRMASSESAAAKLWAKAAEHYRRSYCEVGGICRGMPLHDAHTVAYLLEPGIYTNVTELSVEVTVAEEGRPEHGMSFADRRAHAGKAALSKRQSRIRVLLGVEEERFVQGFVEHLKKLS